MLTAELDNGNFESFIILSHFLKMYKGLFNPNPYVVYFWCIANIPTTHLAKIKLLAVVGLCKIINNILVLICKTCRLKEDFKNV